MRLEEEETKRLEAEERRRSQEEQEKNRLEEKERRRVQEEQERMQGEQARNRFEEEQTQRSLETQDTARFEGNERTCLEVDGRTRTTVEVLPDSTDTRTSSRCFMCF